MLSQALLTAYASKLHITVDEAEAEIHRVVQSVARQFAGKSFGSHDGNDIVQTCIVIGLTALDEGTRYDPARPLERYLFAHMRNKISNMMRSQASRRESPCRCCSVIDPPVEPCELYRKYLQANEFRKSLARVVGGKDAAAPTAEPYQIAIAKELDEYIRARIKPPLLAYYEGMLVDDPPRGARLTQVRDAIREILSDSPYAELLPPTKPAKRRPKVVLTMNGETRTIVEWSEITGIDVRTLYWRKNKWSSVERILTTPAGPTKRRPPDLPAPNRNSFAKEG